jgi:hypothetical protein
VYREFQEYYGEENTDLQMGQEYLSRLELLEYENCVWYTIQ